MSAPMTPATGAPEASRGPKADRKTRPLAMTAGRYTPAGFGGFRKTRPGF
jgi:hypothetical protein